MSLKQKLGRLERVKLSDVWLNEAADFTPWLAQKENLALLGETLNLDLELEAQEKNVGQFRADILCKDTLTKNWVLIENQIARTDHSHLGQILTYAAGLKAGTIIWIASNFTDEHRAALDWLNEVTAESINFFGLEIELWKIGDSSLAPKFNIMSQPNNWTQNIANIARIIGAGDLSDTKQAQLEYWNEFNNLLHERNSIVKPQKAAPQNWMYFAVGRSDFVLSATLNSRERKTTVALVIGGENSKAYYNLLKEDKAFIEKDMGYPLEWRDLPHRKESHITLQYKDADPMDKKRWEEYQQWMADTLEHFYRVFNKRVKELEIENVPNQEDQNQ